MRERVIPSQTLELRPHVMHADAPVERRLVGSCGAIDAVRYADGRPKIDVSLASRKHWEGISPLNADVVRVRSGAAGCRRRMCHREQNIEPERVGHQHGSTAEPPAAQSAARLKLDSLAAAQTIF